MRVSLPPCAGVGSAFSTLWEVGRMLSIKQFTFSAHALERMLDMGVDGDEVRRCLEFPCSLHPSSQCDGRSLYFGDRITCVVNDHNLTVVTVVWRTQDGWKADIAAGEYGGREYREGVGA